MTKLLRLTVLLLCLIAGSTTSFAYVVSEQDAYEAVVKNLGVSARNCDISIGEPNSTQWLVFVDPTPTANWGHECYYYYIDKNKSLPTTLSRTIQQFPPHIEMETMSTVKEAPSAGNLAFNGFIIPDIPEPSSYDNTKTYAVIISGGINKDANNNRYWNDCSFIYTTLKNVYRIPRNNIYLAMGDGDDSFEDVTFMQSWIYPYKQYASSPLDLDGDGINDLKYSATKENISNIFTELSQKMPQDSHLFVYVIDHGGTIDKQISYICLWGEEKKGNEDKVRLYPNELKGFIDNISCHNKTVVLGQCFSGGFINTLTQDDGIITMSASSKGESSYSIPKYGPLKMKGIYDEFVLHFTSAVSGYSPVVIANYNEHRYEVKFQKNCFADTNNDLFVSMREAFDYALSNKIKDNPQYQSMPEYLGEEAGLDRVVDPYHAYLRDDFADDGTQPNSNTTDWWYSPDVWLRPSDDGRTEPYYPESMDNVSTLYAYARVTNCGWKDRPAKGYVHFYYDLSSLGTDKTTWSGGFYYNGRTIGGYIGKAALPEIDVWDDAIVSCKWDVSPVAKLYDLENIGILAIISDSATRPYYPVADNAEILGKRSVAYHSASARSLGSIFSTKMSLTNPSNSAETFSLGLSPQFYDYSWDTSLFDHADVRIIITNPTAASGWTANGKKGNNYTIMNYDPLEIRLNSFSSNICGIPVNGRSILPVTMKITPKNSQSGTAFSLTQTQESTNKIIGGHTFKLTPTFQFHVLIDAQEEAGTCNSLLTAVLPDDTDTDNVSYRWTNSKGDILSEEQILRVSATATAEETYSVNVQKDEESGMASITIENEPVMSLGACTKERIPVSLTKELDSRYTITVSSPVQGRTKTIIVNPGETQYDIPFESNGNEVITVSLSDSNSTIQSIKTIVK